MFPKNIFFYWDTSKDPLIPVEVKNNIEEYKKIYPDFNVNILDDSHIDL
ncbi:unnamed protein product, partial [marine sediment metagenome]